MQETVPIYQQTGLFSFLKFWTPEGSIPIPTATSERPINPKGYFANERTFLSWLQLCLILGGLGIGVVNFGDNFSQISGIVFCMLAIIMMFYALTQYHKRLNQLSRRETGLIFEDWNGTMIMVIGVFLAVVVNFIIHFFNE